MAWPISELTNPNDNNNNSASNRNTSTQGAHFFLLARVAKSKSRSNPCYASKPVSHRHSTRKGSWYLLLAPGGSIFSIWKTPIFAATCSMAEPATLSHITILKVSEFSHVRPWNIHPLSLPLEMASLGCWLMAKIPLLRSQAIACTPSLQLVCQLHWEANIFYCHLESNVFNAKKSRVKHLEVSVTNGNIMMVMMEETARFIPRVSGKPFNHLSRFWRINQLAIT